MKTYKHSHTTGIVPPTIVKNVVCRNMPGYASIYTSTTPRDMFNSNNRPEYFFTLADWYPNARVYE